MLRHDLEAGTTASRSLGAGTESSEFCFVPDPDGTDEGDGVLLGYVLDRAEGRSQLRVLDAMTLEDVASVHLPGRVAGRLPRELGAGGDRPGRRLSADAGSPGQACSRR